MKRGMLFSIALVLLGMVLSFGPQLSAAANQNVGFVDFAFGSAPGADPTADKPQSKLWHNDGSWWAVMFHSASGTWHIYRLNWPSQWVDTGTVVDTRATSRADALWDGSKLYIVSLVRLNSSTSNKAKLTRYSYSSANKTYALDSGFPVDVMTGSAETLALDKDSTGRLWINYTQNKRVYVAHSNGSDNSWVAPFVISGPNQIGSDDISSIVAYDDQNGPSIGVLWSNHTSASAAASMNFSYHVDSDPPGSWQPIETIYGGTSSCLADDHINLKSLQADSAGRIFAAVKTSVGDSGSCTGGADLIRLVVRYPNNTWKWAAFGGKSDQHTRPIVLLDSVNRKVYMFATAPTSCGVIYMKSTNMDNPVFSAGKGTPFISSSTHTCINNVTSTKQTVGPSTGLVVLASDENSKTYLHNAISLDPQGATATATATAMATATSTPLATATATATNVPGATATPTAIATATSTPLATATSTPAGGSSRIKDITFEGGALTGASGFDTMLNTVTLNGTTPLAGSYSALFNNNSGFLREDFTASDEVFVSFSIQLNAKPANAARIVLLTNDVSVGNLNLTTTGALQLRNNSTNIGSVSFALTPGTRYRIGLHQKKGTGGNAVLEAYLAVGDAPFGAPFASSTTQTFTTQATRLSLGGTNSSLVNFLADDVKIDLAAMP